jgi:hypothetical protein
MSSEHASDVDPEAVEDDAAAVLFTVFGFDVVLEEEFVSFPWRAGLKRGPVAVLVSYVLVFLVAAASGVSGGTIVGTAAYLAVVLYGLHGIPVVGTEIPGFLSGVADLVVGIPLLRGFVLTGANHGDPLGHMVATLTSDPQAVGHIDPLPAAPSVPIQVYAAIPALVCVAVGAEFALRYWDEATVDSVTEVARFGAAVAAGYVLVLFVGSFFVSMVGLRGAVIPDRYLTLVVGFGYPAILATVGALFVYVQQEVIASDAGAGEADSA